MNYLDILNDNDKTILEKYLDKLVKDNELDRNLLDKALEEKIESVETSTIKSPLKWTQAVASNLVKERLTDLKKKEIHGCYLYLHLDLQKNEFEGTDEEMYLIDFVEDYVMNQYSINPNDLSDLNHKIVDYCNSHDTKNYSTYVQLLMSSKLLKSCKIPLDDLRKQVHEFMLEWDNLIKSIEGTTNYENKKDL